MMLPSPSIVRTTFSELMKNDPEKAVAYLYELGTSSGYIKTEAIAKNIRWTTPGPYGNIECTINLSKPEKDPKAIAAAASFDNPSPMAENHEPKCDLCWENEKFSGNAEHPAKPGLRIAAINLTSERWGLQFSPYAYFTEHCIALSKEHRPMKIDTLCFDRLLDFVDLLPFYFIGANADLPIVGGSILSHDHFQGGRYEFPLMKAPIEHCFHLPKTPEVDCGIVRWPASVLRLTSENRVALSCAASKILSVWQTYSNEACNIISHSNGTPHNTLNPIVRKIGSTYSMDLVLRNNRTTAQYPWGIFHAHETEHHLKKENIGLIEIMGMAILPPRLAKELPLVQSELIRAADESISASDLASRLQALPETIAHTQWATDIYTRHSAELVDIDSLIHPVIQEEVAGTFTTILETTGVFKRDSNGNAGWNLLFDQLDIVQHSCNHER